MIACDCSEPYSTTHRGNKCVVAFTCYSTRWVEAFAVPNIEAKTIADLLVNEIIYRYGAPRTFLSDRGSNFLSSLVREVCSVMNIHKVFTTSYHPQCHGLVERFNHTLTQP